ncbi:MAG: hypothetical protein ACYC5A_05380 [Thermoleophilia bacterium]
MDSIPSHEPGSEDALRQAQVAFIGKIVAASTHKFHNHLAVIKEYSGLISDLLQSNQPDIGKVISRCGDITGNIIERTDQAAAMEEALNRFVHRGDVATTLFSVGRAAEELFLLYHICASRRRINFSTTVEGAVPEIVNSPALFQFVLYSLTAGYLESLEESGSIAVLVSPGAGDAAVATVSISGEIEGTAGSDAIDETLRLALAKMGAGMEGPSTDGDPVTITLRIPSLKTG